MNGPTTSRTPPRDVATRTAADRRYRPPGPSVRYLVIRVTGVLLAVLALGHFAVTHIATDVAATDSAFIARRWSSLLWLLWDAMLLACALAHAAAGLVAAVRDYRSDPAAQRRWISALTGLSAVLFLIGAAVLLVAGPGRG